MSRSRARVWMPLLALSLLAVPASAALFRVTLNNGTVMETAYQPQEASWDSGMVLLLSDVGNWIGIEKADIQQVDTVSETGAFGIGRFRCLARPFLEIRSCRGPSTSKTKSSPDNTPPRRAHRAQPQR